MILYMVVHSFIHQGTFVFEAVPCFITLILRKLESKRKLLMPRRLKKAGKPTERKNVGIFHLFSDPFVPKGLLAATYSEMVQD